MGDKERIHFVPDGTEKRIYFYVILSVSLVFLFTHIICLGLLLFKI